VNRFGDALLRYDELAKTGRASSLSPRELARRVLAKGKIKMPKKERESRHKLLKRETPPASPSQSGPHSRAKWEPTLSAWPSSRNALLPSSCMATVQERSLKCMTKLAGRRFSRTRHGSCDLGAGGAEMPNDRDSRSSNASVPNGPSLTARQRRASRSPTDAFYAECLALRSVPVDSFLGSEPQQWVLPITSMTEDRLLRELGLSTVERNQIEGLFTKRSASARALRGTPGVADSVLSTAAIVRLAHNPPPEVGRMQQRTACKLLRPYPLGLRFSGSNMNPLPCWLAGAQFIALNMSNNDLAVQLHFALFNDSSYVLKPHCMRQAATERPGLIESAPECAVPLRPSSTAPAERQSRPQDNKSSCHVSGQKERASDVTAAYLPDEKAAAYWPPPRDKLHAVTLEIISLHNLPKRGEQRPHARHPCHRHVSELSGKYVPPDGRNVSSPVVQLAVHPIGGFCAISKTLPLPPGTEIDSSTGAVESNGLNAAFRETVHCITAEPHTTFLRVSVADGKHEVAYETVVLGRLRHGYRVLTLRHVATGTRIELAYLFVRLSFGSVPNLWPTARQLNLHSSLAEARNEEQRRRIRELEALVSRAPAVEMSSQI